VTPCVPRHQLKLHVSPALGEVRPLEISPPLLGRFLNRVSELGRRSNGEAVQRSRSPAEGCSTSAPLGCLAWRGRAAEGPAEGRTPGAAEPAMRRAQPGALDLIEVNSTGHMLGGRRSPDRSQILVLPQDAAQPCPAIEGPVRSVMGCPRLVINLAMSPPDRGGPWGSGQRRSRPTTVGARWPSVPTGRQCCPSPCPPPRLGLGWQLQCPTPGCSVRSITG